MVTTRGIATTLATLAGVATALDPVELICAGASGPCDASVVEEGYGNGEGIEYNNTVSDAVTALVAPGDERGFAKIAALDYEGQSMTKFTLALMTPADMTVDCTTSVAIAVSKDGERRYVQDGLKTLSNTGVNPACEVEWYGSFPNAAELDAKDYWVFFMLRDLYEVPSDEIGKLLAFGARKPDEPIVTAEELAAPHFVTKDARAAEVRANEYELTVTVEEGSLIGQTCQLPPTTLSATIGDGAGCTFEATASDFTFVFSFDFEDVQKCSPPPTERPDVLVYTVTPKLVLEDDWCMDRAFTTQLDIEILALANKDVTVDPAEQDVTQLLINYQDHTIEACEEGIVPMAKLTVFAKAESLVTKDTISRVMADFASQEHFVNKMKMEATVDVATCKPSGPTGETLDNVRPVFVSCDVKYTSVGCLPMNLLGANQDQCEFTSLPALELYSKYTYFLASGTTDSVEEVRMDKQSLPARTFTSGCPSILPQEDVSGQYNLQLDISGSILNNEVASRVSTDNIVTPALSLRVASVEVTLGDLTEVFTPENKLMLMQYKGTPFYTDAHFCRYQDAEDFCRPFYFVYPQGSSIPSRVNPYFRNNEDTFLVPGQGYVECPASDAADVLTTDAFFFTPSNWIFSRFDGAEGTLEITVTAIVDDCEIARRRLQTAADRVQVAKVSGSITVKAPEPSTGGQDGGVEGPEPTASSTGAIVGGLFGALAVVGLAVGGFVLVRRRQAAQAEEAKTTDLGI